MESRHYLLPSDARPRLELVCGTNWRYLHIRVDGTQIGSVDSASHLLRGAEFFLPDGGRLAVKLIKEVGKSDLRVTLNGRLLNSTGLDRTNKDVRTGYHAVLAIGAVNLIFFFLTLLVQPSRGDLRWYDLAFGVAFLFLGWMVRDGSGMALTFALVIYLADTALTLITILSYRYYIAIIDLSINFVLLFFMLQGYGGLGKAITSFRMFAGLMRDTPPEKSGRTALASGTDDAPKLPATLQQVQALLRQAVQLYAQEAQRERARALVKQALQLAPSLADGWYVLAYMVESPADRLKTLERVLALDPFHAGAQDALGKLRRGREFVDDLLRGDRLLGDAQPDVLKQAADALKRGDKQAALNGVKNALSIDPQNADAWFLASYLSQVPEERLGALEEAVKYNPTHAMAQQALARLAATETAFSDLRVPTWMPDMSDALRQANSPAQLAASNARAAREKYLIRTLVGLLIIVGGLIFVVIILLS